MIFIVGKEVVGKDVQLQEQLRENLAKKDYVLMLNQMALYFYIKNPTNQSCAVVLI